VADPLPGAINALILLSNINLSFWFEIVFELLILLLLLGFSAGASASETGFFSLSPAQLNDIKSSRSANSHRIVNLLSHPKKLLATILIANNLVNVGIVILSTFLVNSYFDFSSNPMLGFVIQVVVITSILLLLGEILPKVFANRNPLKIVYMVAIPMLIAEKLLSPLSFFLVRSTRFIDKHISGNFHSITLDDISNAIDITADGKTDEEDRKIMKSITRFGEINAREIMSPRVDVTAIDKSETYSQVLKTIVESGYSRIPVYDETPDHIIGILYIKDLLSHLAENDTFDWNSLVRAPFFVPENKPINDLLTEFQSKKIHLAVVVDEYGGTSGIITLEDIIEEIVGEINDEFDTETDNVLYSKIDENTYIFEGKTSINDMCRVIGADDRIFDDAKGESETLAGLMLELSGKMLTAGESIEFDKFVFRIEAADKRRIKKVKVTIGIEVEDNS